MQMTPRKTPKLIPKEWRAPPSGILPSLLSKSRDNEAALAAFRKGNPFEKYHANTLTGIHEGEYDHVIPRRERSRTRRLADSAYRVLLPGILTESTEYRRKNALILERRLADVVRLEKQLVRWVKRAKKFEPKVQA